MRGSVLAEIRLEAAGDPRAVGGADIDPAGVDAVHAPALDGRGLPAEARDALPLDRLTPALAVPDEGHAGAEVQRLLAQRELRQIRRGIDAEEDEIGLRALFAGVHQLNLGALYRRIRHAVQDDLPRAGVSNAEDPAVAEVDSARVAALADVRPAGVLLLQGGGLVALLVGCVDDQGRRGDGQQEREADDEEAMHVIRPGYGEFQMVTRRGAIASRA